MSDKEEKEPTFSWPSALDIHAYYDLIERLFNDLANMNSREKRARFKPIREIYDLFVLVHTDYVHLLENFHDATYDAIRAAERANEFVKKKSSASRILNAAKKEFLTQRKKRRNDRGEVKSFAASRLDNAVDTYERNYLYQLHWYFQYEASTSENGEKPPKKDMIYTFIIREKTEIHCSAGTASRPQ